jgi:hypothetical protein
METKGRDPHKKKTHSSKENRPAGFYQLLLTPSQGKRGFDGAQVEEIRPSKSSSASTLQKTQPNTQFALPSPTL